MKRIELDKLPLDEQLKQRKKDLRSAEILLKSMQKEVWRLSEELNLPY